MKQLLFIAVMFTGLAYGQSLEFKNNSLGMSLTDFKARNAIGKITLNDSAPNWRGVRNKKLDKVYSLPLCTDEANVFPGSSQPLGSGEVLCNASPWGYEEGRTVAGSPISGVFYRFYAGRLYYIELEFDVSRFVEIMEAFIQKYGKPSNVGNEEFVNVFGAVWPGAKIAWVRDKQAIVAHEGSAGGPGQKEFADGRPSKVVYYDAACAPPKQAPQVDF